MLEKDAVYVDVIDAVTVADSDIDRVLLSELVAVTEEEPVELALEDGDVVLDAVCVEDCE